MICWKRSIQVFFLVLAVLTGRGQQLPFNQLDSFAGRVIGALRSQKEERAYIKTDKSFYTAGEKIWFRSFLVDKYTGKLSAKNNLLFIDLVNENDRVIEKALLQASQFKTDGNLLLGDTLPTGFYWLRVYTKDIVLHHIENIGVQPIYVVSPDRPAVRNNNTGNQPSVESELNTGKLQMDFYPEGGTIVSGANTVIAIRIKDEKGALQNISGFVKDDRDSVVASFRSNAYGLAKVTFFPSIWRKYKVHLIQADKQENVFPLPKINPFSAQLAVIDYKGLKKMRVILEDSIYTKDKKTYIIGLSGDSLCFAGIGNGSYEVTIPESQFPYGVAHFLLLDEQQHLLSERKMFISGNKLNVKLTPDKTSYTARQRVLVDISVSDANYRPVIASMYVKVIDSSVADKIHQVTTSNQHFEGLTDFSQWELLDRTYTEEELDMLMLTQQKSFRDIINSLQVQTGRVNINSEFDSSFYIKGTITDKRGKSLENKIVTLFSGSKNILALADTTDTTGSFCFPLISFYDQTKFNIQVTDKRTLPIESEVTLHTLLHFPNFVTPSYLKQTFTIDGVTEFFTNQRKISVQDTIVMGKGWLKEVIVHSTVKKPAQYNRDKRVSSFSKILTSKMLQNGGDNNIGYALFKIPGITLRDGFLVFRGGNSFHHPSPADEPLLIIDGVPVTPDNIPDPTNPGSPLLQYLRMFDFRIVDFIEVLMGPEAAFFGSRGFNGVILIHTKTKQSDIGDASPNSLKYFILPGYQLPVEFTQPEYSTKENRDAKFPDRRVLLYWNGDVITDEKGKVSIGFFTADPETRYFITVTGISADGRMVNKQITINRK